MSAICAVSSDLSCGKGRNKGGSEHRHCVYVETVQDTISSSAEEWVATTTTGMNIGNVSTNSLKERDFL